MFRSAYRFVPRNPHEVRSNPPLPLKLLAIDFDERIEISVIGAAFGEDAPFDGTITIYAVKTDDRVVPFIVEDKSPIAHLPASRIDRRKDPNFPLGPFKGQIPIVIPPVSCIGSDLRHLGFGSRSTVGYDHSIFNGEVPGYRFKDKEEKDWVCALICEALPILLIEEFSICAAISIDGQCTKNLMPHLIEAEAKATIERLVRESEINKSYQQFERYLEALYKIAPLSLERLTSELFDMEREVFFYGPTYPFSTALWHRQQFLDVLKITYEAFHTKDWSSYELFLTTVMAAFSNRAFLRRACVLGRTDW